MCNDPRLYSEPGRLTLLVDADPRTMRQRVVVAGELDAVGGPELHDVVNDLLHQHQPSGIEINLRGVSFLDSVGIRSLLACHGDARRKNCRLTVSDPHPMAYRVLQITGLLDHLGVSAGGQANQTASM